MCDLICDVITCCVGSCDTGKMFMIKSRLKIRKKQRKCGNKKNLHKSRSRRSFTNGNRNLLKRAYTRESANIIHLLKCDAYR